MGRNDQSVTTSATPHPYDSANWFSCVTLHWMNTVLRHGYQRPLEKDDIFPVRTQDSMEHLVNKLEKLWEQEVNESRLAGSKPRLWKTFSRMFSWKAYTGMLILTLLRSLSTLSLPPLLWFFLSELEKESQQGYSTFSFVLAAGMVLLAVMKGMTKNHFTGLAEMWGVQLKVASIGLICKKVGQRVIEIFIIIGLGWVCQLVLYHSNCYLALAVSCRLN